MTKPLECPNCHHGHKTHDEHGCQVCCCHLTTAQIRRFYFVDEIALALECASITNEHKEH